MYHIYFIPLSVDGYLDHFHILATVNNDAINTGVDVSFELVCLGFLGMHPGVKFLDHMVVLFSAFWGASIQFSIVSSVQFSCSIRSDSLWPHDCSTPGLPVHHQLPELTHTHVHWVSDAIQPSYPYSSPSPPAFNLSQHQGLESVLPIRWPKYCSFSFTSVLPMNIQDLFFFRMDWMDLLAVQGTLQSLLQHHSSKASILWHSAFFIVQFSHPYMTIVKTIALTRWTFVFKVMSLLFNMLSRLVIAFLPRSKHVLISWLQSPSAVILEPKKIKSLTGSFVSPSICQEVMIPNAVILVFWMLNFKPIFFTLLFHFHQEALSSSSISTIKGDVICISEVVDISPGSLDSSLCFIHPNVSHDVLCI